jgi:hypothetical protein
MRRADRLTRRALLRMSAAAAGSWIPGGTVHAQQTRAAAAAIMDHLLLGVADLDRGIDWVERTTGVRAVIGGVHPGRGTRNALLSLGRRQYLEIIAPDPAQRPESLTMNLTPLVEPRLIAWAAVTTDIDALAKGIREQALQASVPRDGSRARPDGRMLKWRAFGVTSGLSSGDVDPIPFFIQWSADSAHPSQESPKGCELSSFDLAHPDPGLLQATLRKMGIDANVGPNKVATLTAVLTTPKGRVTIR